MMTRNSQFLSRDRLHRVVPAVWIILVAFSTSVMLAIASVPRSVAAQESSIEAGNLYSEAQELQNTRQFDVAAKVWEDVFRRFPRDSRAARARHYAGVCRLQIGDYEQAARHFETVSKIDDFEFAEEALLNLGWCQFTLGNQGQDAMYPAAVTTLEESLSRFPKGKLADQTLFFIGEAKYAQGKKEEAIEAYERLVETQVDSPLKCKALYAWGVAEEELGRFAAAGGLYDQFLAGCADSELATEVRMRKAETLFHASEFAEAQKIFGEVASVAGFAAADHAAFRAADCAARQDQFIKAGKLYAAVSERFPDSASASDALLAAGRSFYRADDLRQAYPWLQKSYRAGGPNAPEAAHWLCRILLRQNRPDQAVQLAQKTLPTAADSEFAVDLSMDEADGLYAQADSREQSLGKYREIAAANPEHRLASQALYYAAFAALDLKKFDLALELADQFIRDFPQDDLMVDALSVRAESLLMNRKFPEAASVFRTLAADHSEHPEADFWKVRLGLALFANQQYSEVVAALTPYSDQLDDPNQAAEAAYLIGAAEFRQNHFPEAAASLAASLQANSQWRKSDDALLLLSQAQAQQGQLDEARTSIDKLLSEYPESRALDQANYRLGKYAEAAGDLKAAAASFSKVVEQWPKSPFAPYATYSRGWAEMNSGDPQAGVATFTSLIDGWSDHQLVPEARLGRGTCQRLLGEHEAALADVTAYLESSPTGAARLDALFELGQAQVGLQQYAEAAKTFQSILEASEDYRAADKVRYQLAWALKDQGQSDEAIAEFARLAADFAESPYAAEANFHVGDQAYGQADYKKAADAFSTAKKMATRPELAEQATHKLGWARFRQSEFAAAQAEFEQQLKDHPVGPLANDARFMKAECLFRADQFAPALEAFNIAMKTPPDSPQMQELLMLHGGQSAAQLEQWRDALDFLDSLPDKFPNSALLAEVLFERGRARQQLDQLEEAEADFERAAALSRSAVGARSRFMIGEIQFQQKDYQPAIDTFRRVMFGYGGNQAADDIKPWQAYAGYEAARCAELLIGDASAEDRPQRISDARTFYQYVVDQHPDSEHADKARMRLKGLARLSS